MAIAVITEDFVTRSGLIVQGTGTVTSSTGQTTSLQVNSGAAIAKNLIVGTNARVYGNLTADGNALIAGNVFLNGSVTLTSTSATNLQLSNNTTATTGGAGALRIVGGAYIGDNIVIAGTNASTSSVTSNSLYVAGGVGIANSLVVSGTALFQNDVIFSGGTTNVFSTNTVYTDNLIELHVPSNDTWGLDDGKDIGLRFHYYNGGNQNGALVLANDTKYLEWYNTGAESTTGTFTATTYGTFKTGNIILTSNENATNTQTGSLKLVGGLAVAQDIYVGGVVRAYNFVGNVLGGVTTATNIAGGTTGAILYQSEEGKTTSLPIGGAGDVLSVNAGFPAWYPLSTVPVEYANTATNIDAGNDMQIPYQTGIGQTAFEYNLRYDYSTNTLNTVNAIFTGTDVASSTASGALQVVGGVGIGGNLYVGGNQVLYGDLAVRGGDITTDRLTFNLANTVATTVNIAGSATAITIGADSGYVSIRNTENSVSTLTGALRVAGGVGIGGDVYIGGTTYISHSLIPTANNVALGSPTNPIADLFLGANSLYVDTVKLSATGTTMNVLSTSGPVLLNVAAGIFTTSTNSTSTTSGALVIGGGVGMGGTLYVGGDEILSGNLAVNGGDITTNNATVNLVNNTATTVNFAGSATAITIGATSGYVAIRNTQAVSNSVTGALRVAGGVGVGGNLFVNDTITATNLVIKGAYATSYLGNYGSLYIDGSSGNQLIQGSTNSLANGIGMWTAGILNSTVYSSGGIDFATGKTLRLNNTPTGGVTRMSISAAGNVSMTAGTASTGSTTGTLVVTGGVGISGDLYVGVNGYINGAAIITTATVGNFGVSSLTAGTDTAISASIGAVTIWNTSTLQSITNRSNSTTNAISITNATSATSTITGALRVAGGVGIGGRLYVGDRILATNTTTSVSSTTGALIVTGGAGIGGTVNIGTNLYVSGSIYGTLNGLVTTATNIAAGGPGQIPYQSAKGVTQFIDTGTSGQILISNGITAPTFVNTASLIVGYSINVQGGSAGSLVYQTAPNTTGFISTGSLYVGSAVTATNIIGGTIGSLPYQSSAGITAMLPIGTSGYLLTSDGSNPSWTSLGALSAGTATNVSITNDISSATVHYITFLSTTTNASGIKTSGPSGLTYIPNTGYTGFGVATPTVKVDIGGAVRISGITNITNNTAASSTITGALTVAGGVGIGGNLYVGGNTIGTDQTSVNLLNTVATTVNFAGASTTINIGASTGDTNINNNLNVVGNLTVQGTTTVVDSTVTNISDPIITLGGGPNNSAATVDDNKDRGVAFRWMTGGVAKTGFFGYQDAPGFFTFIPDATISNEIASGTKGAIDAHLAGGGANSIVYQSASNTTAFLTNASTSGYVLTSLVGGVPYWGLANGGNAGSASTATNLAGGSPGQIPYQIASSSTGFISTGAVGNVLVSNGTSAPAYQNTLTLAGTTVATNTTTGALQVRGGVGIGGNLYVGGNSNIAGITTITNTTNSLTTNSGALQVAGGLGVGGNIYSGNKIGWTSATNVSAVYQYYNVATNSLDTVFG